MEALKAELARKRKAKEEASSAGGGKKFMRRSEIEAQRMQDKEREERRELEEKERKRLARLPKPDAKQEGKAPEEALSPRMVQPREEVIKKLRALGEPATFFGEDDTAREKRLKVAEKNIRIRDVDDTGGQQGNITIQLEREDKLRKEQEKAEEAARAAYARDKRNKAAGGAAGAGAGAGAGMGAAGMSEAEAAAADEAEDLADAFKAAAKQAKSIAAEANMCTEEKIYTFFRRLAKEWEAEMEARPEVVKRSMSGENATRALKQTIIYLKPMWKSLKARDMEDDLVRGMFLIVTNMKERNYLAATDVYLKLAVGNAAWPIGVTSVGIHERSAREKISHVMNGKAHVMNDEATRKWLQAVKRLLTFSQRKYPALPSRCVDFNAYSDLGRGGTGSDLKSLQESYMAKEDQTLLLANAPHFHDNDGSVLPPRTLNSVLKHAFASEQKK